MSRLDVLLFAIRQGIIVNNRLPQQEEWLARYEFFDCVAVSRTILLVLIFLLDLAVIFEIKDDIGRWSGAMDHK